jgi:hypothetical protein
MNSTTTDETLALVPKIKELHDKALSTQRNSFRTSLVAAIEAGELLLKAKEAVGHGKFGKWRSEHLKGLSQSMSSYYMRLAKHKDKLGEKEISNGASSIVNGKLSLRAANAFLPKQKPRGNTSNRESDDEDDNAEANVKRWLREVWEPDELVIVLQEVRDTEYLTKLHVEVGKVLSRPTPTPDVVSVVRRPLPPQPTP